MNRRSPHINGEGDERGEQFQDPNDGRHVCNCTFAGITKAVTPRDIDRLQAEIHELFADLWQVPRFVGAHRGFRPAADCYRTPDALTIVLELPGIEPASIKVTAVEHSIVVAGIRERPRVADQVFQQMELEYGHFRREIALGEDVGVEGAEASYEHGMLTVRLPLSQRPVRQEHVEIAVRRNR